MDSPTNPLLSLAEIESLHQGWRASEVRLTQASSLSSQGRSMDAARELRTLLDEDEDHPLGHYYRAQALMALSQPVGALEHVARAVELGLRHPDVLANARRLVEACEQVASQEAVDYRMRLEPLLAPTEPTVSLSMIAKNESKYLAKCLSAVRDCVSQIVLVDTGSTDDTVAIARDFGAEVYHFPWCDDFSAARNHALQYSTGDWILWLDADEELQPESASELKALVSREDVAAAHLRIDNLMGGKTVPFLLTRLWRNHPAIRFKLPVHEQVLWAIGIVGRRFGRKAVEAPSVILHHYGYMPSVAAERRKDIRNLHLLEMLVKREPENTYAVFHYASALREQGRTKEALDWFRRWEPLADATVQEENWIRIGYTNYVAALNDVGEHDTALAVVSRVMEQRGKTISLLYQRALALHRLDRSREALADVNEAETMPRTISGSIETIDFQPLLAPMLTADIHIALGQQDRARQLFLDAIHLDPNNAAPRFSLARLLLADKDFDGAAQQFERIVETHPDEAQAYTSLAQVELFRHRFGRAVELLQQAVRLDSSGDAPRMLGEAHLLDGDLDATRRAWESATDPSTVQGALMFFRLTGDDRDSAIRDLSDPKAADGMWILVGKLLSLLHVGSDACRERMRQLAQAFASDRRLEPHRANLVRIFLKNRYTEGIGILRGSRTSR